jgi:hypothetical protein
MSRVLMAVLVLVVFAPPAVFAQQSEATTYLQEERELVATPDDPNPGYTFCDQNFQRSLTFDLEVINDDGYLDMAIAKSVRNSLAAPTYLAFQNYNDESGGFPSEDGTFSNIFSYCYDTSHVHNAVFGKLRPSQPRKDLAVLRSSRTELYYNTGNGMATGGPAQTLSGLAIDATWGPFNREDSYHDLVITDGSEVRVYVNLNNGYVNGTALTFSIAASRVVLAQMDKNVYEPDDNNRWDLVSFSGSTLSIHLNDDDNGFLSPQEIDVGWTISSVAVGDINNDGYNDVVVAGSAVEVYLNDQEGELIETPVWTLDQDVPWAPVVLIGDIGEPDDASYNDGWNDLVLTGYEAPVQIFINQGEEEYFLSEPQQSFQSGEPYTSTGKVLLADVQNTGGLSVLYATFRYPIQEPYTANVYVLTHVGNPAPAPPRNLTWHGQPSQHPTFVWTPNSERDLAGYNIYRDGQKINQSLITTNSYVDYSMVVPENPGGVEHFYRVSAVDDASNESHTSERAYFSEGIDIEKRSGVVPGEYRLFEAYPNPFNPSTTIEFALPADAMVTLVVYDLLGREVATLAHGLYGAGVHSVQWNSIGVSSGVSPRGGLVRHPSGGYASGVYFARFTATDASGAVRLSGVSKLLLNK